MPYAEVGAEGARASEQREITLRLLAGACLTVSFVGAGKMRE